MKSQAVAALRVELASARSSLLPQIQGLKDIRAIPGLSEQAAPIVDREIGDHERRLELIDAVIAALDALETDGYPEMPAVLVAAGVLAELQGQLAAITAALAEFQPESEATAAIIAAGEPEPKSA